MFYTYLLKSKIKKWAYIGSTTDLRERLESHNNGKVKSTKAYRPFELTYYEAYKNYGLARKREFDLKNHSQQKKLLFIRLGL